jgi:hypothetical protein
VFETSLFYLDRDGRVRSVTFDGREIAVHGPQNVRTFDVFNQWIIFTEEGQYIPRAYNMDTNDDIVTLATTEWVSYVWVYDHEIYSIDHRIPTYIHYFDLPQ